MVYIEGWVLIWFYGLGLDGWGLGLGLGVKALVGLGGLMWVSYLFK